MFDKQLIRKINTGRCLILVGSGPSCEIGYPDWKELANHVYKKLDQMGKIKDHKSYTNFLDKNELPELFRLAESDCGSRNVLINLIKPILKANERKQGVIYELISKWPFACYLTTNFDDELNSYLSKHEYFEDIMNRKDDFYIWRDGVNNIIQKLHSDLLHPDDVILTSRDYDRLYTNASGDYFRVKLRQIFEMFDVLIIGHSFSDPDIKYILQKARETSSPQHPIYMVSTGYTSAVEQEYLEKGVYPSNETI